MISTTEPGCVTRWTVRPLTKLVGRVTGHDTVYLSYAGIEHEVPYSISEFIERNRLAAWRALDGRVSAVVEELSTTYDADRDEYTFHCRVDGKEHRVVKSSAALIARNLRENFDGTERGRTILGIVDSVHSVLADRPWLRLPAGHLGEVGWDND